MLFEPCLLSGLELPNRVVMAPLTTSFAKGGFVNQRLLDFYAERARGGAGLIIVEDAIVEAPRGRHALNDLIISDDQFLPGLRLLAQAIKSKGAKAALQLNHSGRRSGKLHKGQLLVTGGHMPVAPSAIAFPVTGFVVPKELTVEEIEKIEDRFAGAALRAKEAGFDVISLHCSHMYLINQFLSSFSNKRQDAYGGDFSRRLRFLREIILKTKQKIGDDFPLMCRISGEELVEGGLTIEDARQISRRLEAWGVHSISVSMGTTPVAPVDLGYFPPLTASPMRSNRGELVHLATAVRDAVSIPVMTSNRIITPQQAELILEQRRADLIGIGRGLLADPEWPNKAREGRASEIRHCISCTYCSKVQRGLTPIGCVVNPAAGRERELEIKPASKPKTVLVGGAGPSGLEAARVAAMRGHTVTLYEKGKLGGQINLSCIPPGKGEMRLFLDYEREQLKKFEVEIIHEELTPEIVRMEKPDAVVVATGGLPMQPQFAISDDAAVLHASQVLEGSAAKGKVVVIGAKQIGAETAEYIAAKGNQVTIIEASDEIAKDTLNRFRDFLLLSLELLGVKILTNTVVEEVRNGEVVVNHSGRRHSIEADTVVLALGSEPNRELANGLQDMSLETHLVGDCTGIGKMVKAIKGGFLAGLSL